MGRLLLSFSLESTQLFVVNQGIMGSLRNTELTTASPGSSTKREIILSVRNAQDYYANEAPFHCSFPFEQNNSAVSIICQDVHLRRGRENCWPLWVLIRLNDPPIGKLCLDHRRMRWRQYASKRDAEPQTGLMRHTPLLANKVFPK